MAVVNRFPFRLFVLLTAVPALLIGIGLWYLSSLLLDCAITERARLTSPDGRFDLVTFSSDCGPAITTQLALVPTGHVMNEDDVGFASVVTIGGVAAHWTATGSIEAQLPQDAEVYRQDQTVAGIVVLYR